MDFIEKLQALSQKIARQKDSIETEEATKNAFVMPFISALGYDVFDPQEVSPELTADVGIKKGEKVDYAILKDGKVIMLFECKHCGAKNLNDAHMSQLYRYFSVTDARIGVLTNGIQYRFYSDLEKPNQMDNRPFLEINLLDLNEHLVEELKKLTKPNFDLEAILTTAGELKYTGEIKRILEEQLSNPSEIFVKALGSQVYSGRMTQTVLQQFTEITQRALKQFVNEQINKRLKSALEEDKPTVEAPTNAPEEANEMTSEKEEISRITTTEEEREGYYMVKAILREVVDPTRIAHRDTQSYFGILLDDNNRKPLCRLHFNSGNKYIGLFDNEERKEEKVQIENLNDIYKFTDRLKATLAHYNGK